MSVHNIGKANRVENNDKSKEAVEFDTLRFNLSRFEKHHELFKEPIDLIKIMSTLNYTQLYIINELFEAAWKDGFACGSAVRRLK